MIDYSSLPVLLSLIGALVAAGCVAGVLAGLLGVGGGIIVVPVLVYLFDIMKISPEVSIHTAVATSLMTIIPTSISSSRAHHKKEAVDFALFKKWAPFIFVGAALGGFTAKYLEGTQLTLIFGVIAFLAAINLMIPKTIVLSDGLPKSKFASGMLGGFIGLISSWMGIGGGTLSVPSLTMFSFPVHKAVGTSAAFGLVIAISGVIGFVIGGWGVEGRPPFSLGYVNIPTGVVIFSVTIFTAPIGAKIAHAINPRTLKIAFAAFLLLMAVRMLARSF